MDISFSFPYSEPISLDLLRSIKDAAHLIASSRRLCGLQIFVMIFPLASANVQSLGKDATELESYFSRWKMSTSYLLATEHGNPITTSRLFVWGVSSHTLLPFIPPPSELEGQEVPQPIYLYEQQYQ